MNQYKYKILKSTYGNLERTEHQLNELGKEGWLVFATMASSGGFIFVMMLEEY